MWLPRSLDFYILGSPWIPYGYYDYSFDFNSKPVGFAYLVKLSGKGYGKSDAVKTAIETLLTGYTKDAAASTGSETVYKNAKQSVKLSSSNENVIIIVTSLNSDNTNNSAQRVDTTKADSTREAARQFNN